MRRGAAATALGGVTAAAAGPAVVGGAAALGTGVLVTQVFKPVRRWLWRRQTDRRAAAPAARVGRSSENSR